MLADDLPLAYYLRVLGRAVSDDDLKIRHVRLCQCGKLADHDGVCRPGQLAAAQRIDRAWEKQNAERRAERHSRQQPGFRAERNAIRVGMSTRELRALDDIRTAKHSPIAAGNIAPSQGSALHPSVNLALQARSVQLDSDPRWRAADDRERAALLRKHELHDEYEGLGVVQADRKLTAEEKDAAIVAPHNRHLSAAEFARDHPGYGSPSTVARKRRWFDATRCTFCGLPPPQKGCRCPTCRHATD